MISFGIIGCGRIAERHAVHISNQGRLMDVCDIDERACNTESAFRQSCEPIWIVTRALCPTHDKVYQQIIHVLKHGGSRSMATKE